MSTYVTEYFYLFISTLSLFFLVRNIYMLYVLIDLRKHGSVVSGYRLR